MIRLPESRDAWGTPEFNAVLKREVEALSIDQLQLQQGLVFTSYVVDEPCKVRVISADDSEGMIRAKIGVFYRGIIAGCSCADDPSPVEPMNEYCELLLELNKHTGETSICFENQDESN